MAAGFHVPVPLHHPKAILLTSPRHLHSQIHTSAPVSGQQYQHSIPCLQIAVASLGIRRVKMAATLLTQKNPRNLPSTAACPLSVL